VESFENLIQPESGFPGTFVPVGAQFGSGIVFVSPDYRQEGVAGLTIADLGVALELEVPEFGYDLGSNGTVRTSDDLPDGVAFAAPGGAPTDPFFFELPVLTPRVGVYASAFNGAPISLFIYDEQRQFIESLARDSGQLPLDASNFLGLSSETPIGAIGISSAANFVFDGIVFEAPEPGAPLSCAASLATLGFLARRRRTKGSRSNARASFA